MQCQKRQEELRKTAESFMNNHFSDSSFQDAKVLYRTVVASEKFPRDTCYVLGSKGVSM